MRDDAFLAHVETLGEQLRMGRALYPDEIDPKDFVLSRTGPVRGNFLRTLVNVINLYNEAGVGGTPISDIPFSENGAASEPTNRDIARMDRISCPG